MKCDLTPAGQRWTLFVFCWERNIIKLFSYSIVLNHLSTEYQQHTLQHTKLCFGTPDSSCVSGFIFHGGLIYKLLEVFCSSTDESLIFYSLEIFHLQKATVRQSHAADKGPLIQIFWKQRQRNVTDLFHKSRGRAHVVWWCLPPSGTQKQLQVLAADQRAPGNGTLSI